MTHQHAHPWARKAGAALLGSTLLLGAATPAFADDQSAGAAQAAAVESEVVNGAEPEVVAVPEPVAEADADPEQTEEVGLEAEQGDGGSEAVSLELTAPQPAPSESGDSEEPAEPAEEGEEQSSEGEAADPSAEPGTAESAAPRLAAPKSGGDPADIVVSGIQPGQQRFLTESVRNARNYKASVAGPSGIVFRLEADGYPATPWHTPGEGAFLWLAEGGRTYTGTVTLVIRNNGDQVADVFADRGWEESGWNQIRVFATANRSEIEITGDVMPLGENESVTVGITVTSASGQNRSVDVQTAGSQGRFSHTMRGLAPGAYTVHAATRINGQFYRDVTGARVIATDDAPRVSLVYEPEMGQVNGWFPLSVGVRVNVTDDDGVEWIRASRNGEPWNTVQNGSLMVFNTDGRHIVKIWARDGVGNESNPRTLEFGVDQVKPTLQLSGALSFGKVNQGQPATAEFSCHDATSGVESCTISIDGAAPQPSGVQLDTRVRGEIPYVIVARDQAGHERRLAGTIEVTSTSSDTTPPTVIHRATPAPNAQGWNTGEVEVILDARDDESGLADFVYRIDGGAWTQPPVLGEPVRVLVQGDGRHTVQWLATDADGNQTPLTGRSVWIDGTVPSVSFDPEFGADPVRQGSTLLASFSCDDATSGVDSCVGSTPNGAALPTDELGWQTLQVVARDVAGNSVTRQAGYRVVAADEMFDATATPDRADNGGWWNDSVSVLLDPVPATGAVGVVWSMSGAQTGSGVTDGGEDVIIEADGLTTLSYRAVDDRGRRGEPKTLEVRIDRVAPSASSTIDPTPNARGWLRRDATMQIDSSDQESGVSRVEYRVDGGALQRGTPGVTRVQLSDEGEYPVEYRVWDLAGNSTAVRSHAVRLDKTDPVVEIDPAISGARVEVGAPFTSTYECSDSLSGLQSCVASVPLGGQLPTDEEGVFELSVTAVDNAGNETRRSVQYTVVAAGEEPGGDPNGDPNGEPGGDPNGEPNGDPGAGGNGGADGGSNGGSIGAGQQPGGGVAAKQGLPNTGGERSGVIATAATVASLIGAALLFGLSRRAGIVVPRSERDREEP